MLAHEGRAALQEPVASMPPHSIGVVCTMECELCNMMCKLW